MSNDTILSFGDQLTYIEKGDIQNVTYISIIATTIERIMALYFFKDAPKFTLINDPTLSFPMTMPTYDEIYICCEGIYWSQIAYQFSHEMCHLLIGKPVSDNLCWFEETIAELSSWFFMEKLSNHWEEIKLFGNPGYAISLRDYVHNRIDKISVQLSMPDLFDDTTELSQLLKAQRCDRDKNAFVAKQLFPIFIEYPELWAVVPKLACIPAKLTFEASLLHWKNASGANYETAINSVIACFHPHK